MEYRIFFKDKENEFKGPFTEREVQEWYRKGWFDNSFPFYFTRSNESPPDENDSGITLASLRSLNGFGCPFFKSDGKEKREFEKKRNDEEEKLKSMQKEISELHQQFDAILSLKKTIEEAERKVQIIKAAASDSKKKKDIGDQKYGKPKTISDDIWQKFYELGNSVADFVMDGFDWYAKARFLLPEMRRMKNIESSLDKVKGDLRNGLNLVCEHILVEKMKEKEFFCCALCFDPCYNYKQALVHFTCDTHHKKEIAVFGNAGIEGIEGIRRVLDLFTKLPQTLYQDDAKIEADRRKRNGPIYLLKLHNQEYLPNQSIMDPLADAYFAAHDKILAEKPESELTRLTKTPMIHNMRLAIDTAKSDIGQMAMTTFHESLKAPTHCVYCQCVTGDREGYYAHFISVTHMLTVSKRMVESETGKGTGIDIFTLLVNVHRQDVV